MNVVCKLVILVLAGCGVLALAVDNPFAGTWKLNAAKSKLHQPLPAFVRDGILKIPAEIFTGTKSGKRPDRIPAPAGGADSVRLFKFDLSQDARTLTFTRPATDPELRIVFERLP